MFVSASVLVHIRISVCVSVYASVLVCMSFPPSSIYTVLYRSPAALEAALRLRLRIPTPVDKVGGAARGIDSAEVVEESDSSR